MQISKLSSFSDTVDMCFIAVVFPKEDEHRVYTLAVIICKDYFSYDGTYIITPVKRVAPGKYKLSQLIRQQS